MAKRKKTKTPMLPPPSPQATKVYKEPVKDKGPKVNAPGAPKNSRTS